MRIAIIFGVGGKTGVLLSAIGSSRIALIFADLLNPVLKLAHLHLDELPIVVSTKLF